MQSLTNQINQVLFQFGLIQFVLQSKIIQTKSNKIIFNFVLFILLLFWSPDADQKANRSAPVLLINKLFLPFSKKGVYRLLEAHLYQNSLKKLLRVQRQKLLYPSLKNCPQKIYPHLFRLVALKRLNDFN